MDEYRSVNLRLWNEWTRIHEKSAFYDVEGFKAGRDTLLPPERAELGDVRGLRILHLQCHFGLDTLSLARRGAEVVGVDFSDEAISLARRLAGEIGIPATFVEADIYDLATQKPEEWRNAFDLVYVTYGAIEWLGDLEPWASLIEYALKPGGRLYLCELHPLAILLELEEREKQTGSDDNGYRLYLAYGYFEKEPSRDEVVGSYADRDAMVEQDYCYGWTHTLSEIVGVLLGEGLVLEHLHEFPYSCSPFWPQMQERDGVFWLLDDAGERRTDVPFLFSISARKPAR